MQLSLTRTLMFRKRGSEEWRSKWLGLLGDVKERTDKGGMERGRTLGNSWKIGGTKKIGVRNCGNFVLGKIAISY